MGNPTGQIWPLLVVFPAFVLLGIAISFGISRLGWRRFAERQTSDVRIPDDAKAYRFQTIFMGSGIFKNASYKGCMNFYIDRTGLFLRPVWLARLFHPTLYFAWNSIKAIGTEKVFFSRLTNVEFTGDLPPVTIPGKMGRRIHEAWCNYTNRPFQPE